MTAARRSGIVIFGVILIALFVILAILQGIGRPSIPSGDIAVVKDTPASVGNISKKDYDKAFERSWKQGGLPEAPKRGDAQFEQAQANAMNFLLSQAWIIGEAKELGIVATDRDVESEMKNVREQYFPEKGSFQKYLKENNFTQDEIKDQIRMQVLSTKIQEKITDSVGKPSSREIRKVYEANKQAWTTPESRDILLIQAESQEQADKAMEALGDDPDRKTFARVAKKFSKHASSGDGGKTAATEGAFPDPAGEAMMEAGKDSLEGPIEADDQFYIFKVLKIEPEKTKALNKVADQIAEEQILPARQQQAMQQFVANFTAKWTSRTNCKDGYVVAQCANYEGDAPTVEGADPACTQPGAGSKALAGELNCPAPVLLRAPAAPGANAAASLITPTASGSPQGPIPSGDSTKTPEGGAGMEGIDPAMLEQLQQQAGQ